MEIGRPDLHKQNTRPSRTKKIPKKIGKSQGYDLEKINEIIFRLRDPETGCPWDQIQTNKSLAKHTIEEAYELANAVENSQNVEICLELGDLLFNILFHAYLAKENDLFSLEDIIENVVKKMISRHPHVFGEKSLTSVSQVEEQWEKIKRKEKNVNQLGRMRAEFDGVAPTLPALTYAAKIQKRAAAVGFDWDYSFQIINKIYEETDEFVTAEENNDKEAEFEEFGDLLFSVVNLGRFKKIDPEMALRAANKKFIDRFLAVETHLNESALSLENSTKDEMNAAWQKIKDRH